MTRKIRIAVVALVASLLSQATFAQYAASAQQVAGMEQTTSANHTVTKTSQDGQIAANVGKTLMITGASIAAMGITTGLANTIIGNGEGATALVLGTAIGTLCGGLVTLTGLPFHWVGKARMQKNGASMMSITSEGQEGYATHIELGYGLANSLSLDAVAGYNFNEHLFVGGGVGYSTFFDPVLGPSSFFETAVPLYANVRLTSGSKRLTPYMGGRLGCTLNGFGLYSGIEFGTNIRSKSGSQGESWWIGIKSDCVGLELQTMGLTVGKSF